MGPMLRAVNAIAAAISHEHPAVAVETLAYQQTRGVPKITQPHPNVIVRVCSIVRHKAEVCCDIPTTMLVWTGSQLRAAIHRPVQRRLLDRPHWLDQRVRTSLHLELRDEF